MFIYIEKKIQWSGTSFKLKKVGFVPYFRVLQHSIQTIKLKGPLNVGLNAQENNLINTYMKYWKSH